MSANAETPIRNYQTSVAGIKPTVFCEKCPVYWQNAGFWRFQTESADSKVQPLHPKVESADANVEDLYPNIEPARPQIESADANSQSARPQVEVLTAQVEVGSSKV
jgi:hypothetical protein